MLSIILFFQPFLFLSLYFFFIFIVFPVYFNVSGAPCPSSSQRLPSPPTNFVNPPTPTRPPPPKPIRQARPVPCPTRSSNFFEGDILVALMMEVESSSETSASIYQTTQCNIREDSFLLPKYFTRSCDTKHFHCCPYLNALISSSF